MIAEFAWLVPAVMGVSALVILVLGKRLPFGGAEVGITAIGACLLLSIAIAIPVFSDNVSASVEAEEAVHEEEEAADARAALATTGTRVFAAEAEGEEPLSAALPGDLSEFRVEQTIDLAPLGDELGGDQQFVIPVGQRVDGLTVMMFLLVTFVSLMVHVYSLGYMHGDPRFTWYYALLSMFTASMLLLVIADNMLQLLVGWELVGICSFLLIGFWWEEKKNSDAAIKAFLTTKLGDVGLITGVVTLWAMFGTFDISEIIAAVETGGYSQGLLTFGVLALFFGAVGKSAQFPLHTWLPDAMAGPTPVSALIHAATMVTAGVFLFARIHPVFQASDTAVVVVAVIGGITLFAMGLLAIVQDDVKRVLAYSTVSQLGYMVMALAFSYTAGIFHLFTHGFFKALLFLGAGSLIHSVHSNNMSDMGGLRKAMPITFWTFLIGSLALVAFPPLAGFWSKDEVIIAAQTDGTALGWVLAVVATLGGLVTAFYMTRAIFLIFFGEYRGHGHPHESPWTMAGPLVALAVPAALIGFVNLPFDFAHPYGFSAWTMYDLGYFVDHPAKFSIWLALIATAAGGLGILMGWRMYRTAPSLADDPTRNMGAFSTLLERKYYLDDLYHEGVVRPLREPLAQAAYWFNDHVLDRIVYTSGRSAQRLGDVLYRGVDQRGIDGFINGVGTGTRSLGGIVRLAQSGNVQLYAGALFMGVLVLGVLFAVA